MSILLLLLLYYSFSQLKSLRFILQELLDCHLLDRCRLISTPKGCRSVIVTRPMEQVLVDNFQLVNNISEDIERLSMQIVPRNSMIEQMISRFTYYLEKVLLQISGELSHKYVDV